MGGQRGGYMGAAQILRWRIQPFDFLAQARELLCTFQMISLNFSLFYKRRRFIVPYTPLPPYCNQEIGLCPAFCTGSLWPSPKIIFSHIWSELSKICENCQWQHKTGIFLPPNWCLSKVWICFGVLLKWLRSDKCRRECQRPDFSEIIQKHPPIRGLVWTGKNN